MQSKNQYFIGLLKLLKNLPPLPRSEAMAENFIDLILTYFPSFKLNAILRPGRLFQKLSSSLGFI